jgi:GntR family transcriptional regulator
MRPTKAPLYQDIHEQLKRRIISGEYTPGTALPSEPKLRDEFGVSTITVRRAIHELALDGLVEPRQGVGNIVLASAERPVVVGMSSFTTDVVNGRLRIIRTLLQDNFASANADVAEMLRVQNGSLLRHLVRLDHEGNAPFSVDEVFIPPSLATHISPEIASSPAFMHEWQDASGLELVRTEYDIWVESASADVARLLQVEVDSPMLVTGELVYDSASRPVAWIVSRYRGDRGRLSGSVMLQIRETDRGVVGE